MDSLECTTWETPPFFLPKVGTDVGVHLTTIVYNESNGTLRYLNCRSTEDAACGERGPEGPTASDRTDAEYTYDSYCMVIDNKDVPWQLANVGTDTYTYGSQPHEKATESAKEGVALESVANCVRSKTSIVKPKSGSPENFHIDMEQILKSAPIEKYWVIVHEVVAKLAASSINDGTSLSDVLKLTWAPAIGINVDNQITPGDRVSFQFEENAMITSEGSEEQLLVLKPIPTD